MEKILKFSGRKKKYFRYFEILNFLENINIIYLLLIMDIGFFSFTPDP